MQLIFIDLLDMFIYFLSIQMIHFFVHNSSDLPKKWYLDCYRKWRNFVFPKTFLCVRVIRIRVRVIGNMFKYVFGETSIRASVLETEKIEEINSFLAHLPGLFAKK